MNKKEIILINILLLVLLFGLAEFLTYKKVCANFSQKPQYSWTKKDYSVDELKKNMRQPVGLKYKKAPVLIYGCSYAYGFSLDEKASFGYKLSEKTKRPVYNFAMSSKGLQDALYLIKNDEKITPEPKYIFYVFINDHVRRMFVNCNKIDNINYLTYKNKNGELVENIDKNSVSDRLYLLKEMKNLSYYALKNVFKNQIYDLTKLYLISIKNELQIKYPDAKFVVLDYENGKKNYLTEERVEDLHNCGIEVVNLNKEFNDVLKTDEYRNSKETDTFRHPNEKAWDLIVDFLVRKYGL